MELTVAICTYRRAEALRAALESLCQCEPITALWQLLVIDNAVEDEARAVVKSFEGHLPVTYVTEAQAGVSHARNRALREAAAPVVLFADDDVTFDRGWLAAMSDAVRDHSDCDFFGGRVLPVWSSPQPKWFDIARCPMLQDMIVHYDGGDTSRAWDRRELKPFFCANMAVRVAAAQRVGGFDPGAGHVGRRLGQGEDGFMVDALVKQGGKGWYVADAMVHHPVPEQRVTRTFARRFAWRQGWVSAETHRRLEARDANQTSDRLPRWWYRVAVEQGVKSLCQWVAGLLTLNSPAAFAAEFRLRYNVSRFRHGWRRRDTCPA